jgi:hypothetical protein
MQGRKGGCGRVSRQGDAENLNAPRNTLSNAQ